MSAYRRFVAYVYEYHKEQKKENRGFIKVEVRNDECTIQIHLQCPHLAPAQICKIYGFIRKKQDLLGVPLGECQTGPGKVEYQIRTNANHLQGQPVRLEDLGGMILLLEGGGFYGTQWDDNPISPLAFQLPKESGKTAEKPSQEPQKAEEASTEKPLQELPKAEETSVENLSLDPLKIEETSTKKQSLELPKTEEISAKKPLEKEPEIAPEASTKSASSQPSAAFLDEAIPPRNEEKHSIELEEEQLENATAETSAFVESAPTSVTEISPKSPPPAYFANAAAKEADAKAIRLPAPEEEPKETPGTEALPPETSSDLTPITANDDKLFDNKEVSPPPAQNTPPNFTIQQTEIPVEATLSLTKQEEKIVPVPEFPQKKQDRVPEPEAWEEEPDEPTVHTTEALLKEILPPPKEPTPKEFWPFEDGEITDCQKISHKNLEQLHLRDQGLKNNRFLLYGYQYFGFLLLGKLRGTDQYILGVPGVYDQQERFMARTFGFPHFKGSRSLDPSLKKGGYWYRLIQTPALAREKKQL